MVQDGKLFCDNCEIQIMFLGDGTVATQVLVEFVKGQADRHYCANCIDDARNSSRRPLADPLEREERRHTK